MTGASAQARALLQPEQQWSLSQLVLQKPALVPFRAGHLWELANNSMICYSAACSLKPYTLNPESCNPMTLSLSDNQPLPETDPEIMQETDPAIMQETVQQ